MGLGLGLGLGLEVARIAAWRATNSRTPARPAEKGLETFRNLTLALALALVLALALALALILTPTPTPILTQPDS